MSLHETWFAVPKMDCPSEERMIRLALDDVQGVRRLTCDLAGRRVRVLREGDVEPIADGPSEVAACAGQGAGRA